MNTSASVDVHCARCGSKDFVAPGAINSDDMAVIPRATAERCLALIERVLAFSGENPEPEIIKLQHELAALLGATAPVPQT